MLGLPKLVFPPVSVTVQVESLCPDDAQEYAQHAILKYISPDDAKHDSSNKEFTNLFAVFQFTTADRIWLVNAAGYLSTIKQLIADGGGTDSDQCTRVFAMLNKPNVKITVVELTTTARKRSFDDKIMTEGYYDIHNCIVSRGKCCYAGRSCPVPDECVDYTQYCIKVCKWNAPYNYTDIMVERLYSQLPNALPTKIIKGRSSDSDKAFITISIRSCESLRRFYGLTIGPSSESIMNAKREGFKQLLTRYFVGVIDTTVFDLFDGAEIYIDSA